MASYADTTFADTYFTTRLHAEVWSSATPNEQRAALEMASNDIDRLNFAGMKHARWVQYQVSHDVDALREASATQARQFPRGQDEEVPDDVKIACCEIALRRLDGYDPDMEYEALTTVSEGYSSVRRTYSRSHAQAHVLHGIASPVAWRYLLPYLRDGSNITLRRV